MKGPFSNVWVGVREAKWLRKHPGVSEDWELLPPIGIKEQDDRAARRTKKT